MKPGVSETKWCASTVACVRVYPMLTVRIKTVFGWGACENSGRFFLVGREIFNIALVSIGSL